MKVTWVEHAILLGYILDEVLNFEEHTAFLKDSLFTESRIYLTEWVYCKFSVTSLSLVNEICV